MRYLPWLVLLIVAVGGCVLPLERGTTIDPASDVKPGEVPPPIEVKRLSTNDEQWVVLGRRIEGDPPRLTVDIDRTLVAIESARGIVIEGTTNIRGTNGPVRFTGNILRDGDAVHAVARPEPIDAEELD